MKRKTKDKLATATDAILEILATSSLLTLAAFLAQGRNADKIFKKLGLYSIWRIKKSLREMRINGFIEYCPEDEHSPIYITKKGFFRYTKAKLKKIKGNKWDHFWRLIMFDISERSNMRRKFQHTLKSIGCYKIQKSVYAYPFDCKDDIKLLASNFKISSRVEILTIPNLGSHERLARRFYFERQKS
ncbi:MAG: CRISPR-associated endonuclease Cas2 [Patescibacteria group bacterium]|nr:CRISPR-associated endonuclease Cas2 [Patescibacteria group bacterium]MBU2508849.1 CRISPR-associated endonuclease Cas2 [Patescibacteria group bacterium]